MNPNCVVPALVLDDGTCIGETVAICRYLEETHPEPNLMGRDAKEKALIEMWNRQAELEGYLAAVDALRNSAPMFEDRGVAGVTGGVPQIPALAERGKQSMGRFFSKLDGQLAENAISQAIRSPSPTSRPSWRSTSPSGRRSRFPRTAPTSPAGSRRSASGRAHRLRPQFSPGSPASGADQSEEMRIPSMKCRRSRKNSTTEGTVAITVAVSTTFGPVDE